MTRKRARAPSTRAATSEATAAEDNSSTVAKHSLVIAGHSTSVSLERIFWEALKAASEEEGCSLAGLVARIDAGRGRANLSSALRVYAMERALGRKSG
ncbi:arylsulfate sulfotransferase [Methylosinus sp. R-45379]|jgi:predicted DNA-binding ribbon-helix-helix protein|uniref:ribbon-helix-helix domain-containing protein n=1 Tax=unclassified Methylosinus TaxID=2624500 RepID=UPI00046420DD|nr:MULTISPECIES: ribbon-helix-helix domain-containing protein [unclassified Methylosinus]OAI22624.1 arylsulfate sulfotransferase [Methylosinus sp. R-45379]TDX66694.1 putative DNA-binding ribbon-helix-helix protein [Methylosinus sp. sav-2]